jgi:hypothetical protein
MPAYAEHIPDILFRSRNRAPFRALMIGNEQARYIAPLLELVLADCSCDYLSFHHARAHADHAAIEKYLDGSRGDYQLVLAQPLGRERHALAKEALIDRFGRDRTFFLMSLHFYGLHPDVTTLGQVGAPVLGPMAEAHSRIALGAWLADRTADEIVEMYNPTTMEQLGYLSFFDQAANELRGREANCDTQFADNLIGLAKSAFSFYGFQYPSPNLLISFVAHVRDLLHSRKLARMTLLPPNAMLAAETLAIRGTWPIYPELRPLVAPHFPLSTTFVLPDHGTGSEVVSREIFVRRSLALYDRIGRESIAALHQAQNCHELVQQAL